MQNFVTAAHFARQIVGLESSGVSIKLALTCVDIWDEAWNRATIQKVLPGVLIKRNKRSQTQIWPKRQFVGQRDRVLPLLRSANTTWGQSQRCHCEVCPLPIYLLKIKVLLASLWNLPALWPGSRCAGAQRAARGQLTRRIKPWGPTGQPTMKGLKKRFNSNWK